MKNREIYFVQPNSILGNSIYFPYAVGVIASYSFQFEDIINSYELSGIVYKEDSCDDVLKNLDNPYIVAFSNYFWNYQYNLSLAQKIKDKFPDCKIIFGGHQLNNDISWLEKYSFIDILIYGEGEIPFLNILRAFNGDYELKSVANIAFRDINYIIKTKIIHEGVIDYPSPYISGVFDKLLNVDQNLLFNAQLETTRGCPYHCSFCDWCSYDIKMRQFKIEKIKEDLRWISEHKISYCMCIDSNFGFFERDLEIAQFAVELKKKNGYPDKFGACFAKNKTNRIFAINKMLNDTNMSKGVSLAFQSMSDIVLENVSRSNMNKDNLKEQLAKYHEVGIPTYTELILGLPGETLESFKNGICELLELGQHDSINVFRCEVYPNSTLANKEYMDKFGIKTAINKLNINHCKLDTAIFAGGLEFIVETSTMSADELVEAHLFATCIQSVHCHGLLQCFAMYFHNDLGLKYYDFYTGFIEYFIQKTGLIGEKLRKIVSCIKSIADGKSDISYINPLFRDITWPYEEALLLDFIYSLDQFLDEAYEYIKTFGVDKDIIRELLIFSKNLILLPNTDEIFCDFSFDFATYFNDILTNKSTKLKKEQCRVCFYSDKSPKNWCDYAKEIVWYGRRNKKTIRKVKKV